MFDLQSSAQHQKQVSRLSTEQGATVTIQGDKKRWLKLVECHGNRKGDTTKKRVHTNQNLCIKYV